MSKHNRERKRLYRMHLTQRQLGKKLVGAELLKAMTTIKGIEAKVNEQNSGFISLLK